MALENQQLFIGGNFIFLAVAFVFAIAILIFASRHFWLVAYGPEQARLRFWAAVCLVLLTLLAIAALVFNLLFS